MRLLVATASKHGATNEIAIEIGRTLTDHGVETEVLDVEDVSALDSFDAVILGSAVYIGQWLKPATTFAETHTDELRARPTWLFSSGPIGDPPKPQKQQAGKADEILVSTGAPGAPRVRRQDRQGRVELSRAGRGPRRRGG